MLIGAPSCCLIRFAVLVEDIDSVELEFWFGVLANDSGCGEACRFLPRLDFAVVVALRCAANLFHQ